MSPLLTLPHWVHTLAMAALWSGATILVYLAAKRIYRRRPRWWLSPLVITPLVVGTVLVSVHASYRDYIAGTGWLVALLGPATVAFAVPIYEKRALIRRQWPLLLAGMVAGSLTSILSSWALATALGVDGAVRLSLLPRSMSTPFAMTVSGDIGGVPDLTAAFVILTGIIGAATGDVLLARMPTASALARGASLGVAAHGAGTARAHQIGREEGAVAGLAMVLVGLMNVLAAPLVAHLLR